MKHVKTNAVATLLPLLLIAPSIVHANWHWGSVASNSDAGYFTEEIVEKSRSSETPTAVRPEATEVVEGGDDPCGAGMWGRTTGGMGSCPENTTEEESDTSVSEPANYNNTRSNRSPAETYEEAESTTTEDADRETVSTTDSAEVVEEATPDATSEPEPKPKATFFQRIVDFFTGWFK